MLYHSTPSTPALDTALPPRPLPAHIVSINRPEEFLAALSSTSINMAILESAPSPELARLADSIRASTEEIQFRGVYTREKLLADFPVYLGSRASLSPEDREFLLARALESFDLYHSLTGSTNSQVVLSKVDAHWLGKDPRNAVAQEFHYEAGVPLNLVSTLVGRGTEYTPNDNVNREALYRAAQARTPLSDEEILIDPSKRLLMPTGATVIFKGELIGFPGERGSSPFLRRFNPERGLIHRGVPLEEGEVRLRFNVYSTKLPSFMS